VPIAADTLAEVLAYYDTLLSFGQRYFRVPGIQVAVLADGEVAYEAAFGHANVETDTKLTTRHLFRAASHSKTVASVAVLHMVERGLLRLDDQAAEHVKELEGTAAGRLTLRDLLSHGSGLTRNGPEADYWQLETPFPDRDQLLGWLTDASSNVIEDNVRFKYSNIGYGLVGLVLDAIGHPFHEHVRTEIAGRLGLRDLSAELDPARRDEYATGYSALAYGDRVPIGNVETRALASATGVTSTARDLATFFSALLPGDERLLSDASKRLMGRPLWTTGSSDETQRYALGLHVVRIGDHEVLGHGGLYPGHTSRTLIDPERRIVVSVLVNAVDGNPVRFVQQPFKLLDLAASRERGLADLARFAGRFGNIFGLGDIALLGGQLYWLSPDQDDPTAEAAALEVDGDALRVVGGSGYGAYGESFLYTFEDGKVVSVRSADGMLVRPYEVS
jgi:CubicO group peptidase (beta-lactamase class C family)